MIRLFALFMFVVMLTLWIAPSALLAAADEKLVTAEVLANTTAVVPGKPFQLGVRMSIKPGWHIYWLNPGESGLATKIRVTAPDGYTVDPVQYPVPAVIPQPNDVIGYGYEHEAFFTIMITPPKDLGDDKDVTIDLKTSWLSCEKVCILGDAPLTITLPIAADAKPDNEAIFAAWRDRLVIPDVTGSSGLKLSRTERGLHVQATVHWTKLSNKVEFIPGPLKNAQIESLNLVNDAENNQTRISFDVVVLKGMTFNQESLQCLLVYSNPPAVPRAVALNVSLKESSESGK